MMMRITRSVYFVRSFCFGPSIIVLFWTSATGHGESPMGNSSDFSPKQLAADVRTTLKVLKTCGQWQIFRTIQMILILYIDTFLVDILFKECTQTWQMDGFLAFSLEVLDRMQTSQSCAQHPMFTIEALDLQGKRVALIGHSMGGRIALQSLGPWYSCRSVID